ncbi:MAG: hypothetical protein J0L73_25805 [Verrucomicrobia bacterium]|nr:hypothetical protein [Verrucomicrobiota bacterium]
MPRLIQLLLPAMALVALVSAQVFGLGRGFVCDCGGVEKVTLADHCHGPHSADCHEHEAAEPCHGDEDHHEEDSHEHEALSESLRASVSPGLAFSALALTAFSLALEEWKSPLLVPCAHSMAVAEIQMDSGQATQRSWSQVLVHAVALRI